MHLRIDIADLPAASGASDGRSGAKTGIAAFTDPRWVIIEGARHHPL